MSTVELLNDDFLNGALRCPVTRDEFGCLMRCCPPNPRMHFVSKREWFFFFGGGVEHTQMGNAIWATWMLLGKNYSWYCRVLGMAAHTAQHPSIH